MKTVKSFFENLSEVWHDLWTKKTQKDVSEKFYFSDNKRSSSRFVLRMVILVLGLVVIDLFGYYVFDKGRGHNYVFTVPALLTLLAIPAYFLAKLIAYHTHWFPEIADRTVFAIITWIILTVLFTVLMIVFV